MAPYAPAQVQLLPSWDNGSYSPVLDVDDRYPTLEPSEDQYNGPYLSNILPPLSSATSLIRSSSQRHSWSCHRSEEPQCCDSGADSPHYRQIPYTESDYVYSPDGYLPSQHTPNDQVSPPTSSFGPVRLIFEAISLLFSISSPMASHFLAKALPRSKSRRRSHPFCSTREGGLQEVGRRALNLPPGLRARCLIRRNRHSIPTSPHHSHRHRQLQRRRRLTGVARCLRFNALSHTTSHRDMRMPNLC